MARYGTGTNGDKVDFGDLSHLGGLTGLTVAGWFNFASLASRQDVFTQWGAGGTRCFNLLVGVTTSRVQFYVSTDTTTAVGSGDDTADLVTGRWYHLGGSWQPNTVTVYRDGVARSSATATMASTANGSAALRIGNGSEGTERPINGAAADCGIWSAVLTSAEWIALAAGTPANNIRPEALIFYVPLTSGSGPEMDTKRGSCGVVTQMRPSGNPPHMAGKQMIQRRSKWLNQVSAASSTSSNLLLLGVG